MEHSTARRVALATAFVLAVTTGAADILPAMAAESVAFAGPGVPGTIVIRTSERRLYLIVADGRALRYPVGVGRAGRQWAGSSFIDAKFVEPNWVPRPPSAPTNRTSPTLSPAARPPIRWAQRP